MTKRLSIVGAVSLVFGVGGIAVSLVLQLAPIVASKNLPCLKEIFLTLCFSYFPSYWCSAYPGGRYSDRLADLQQQS